MDNKIKACLEAILFSFGDTVPVGKIATALDTDKETAKKYLAELQDLYANDESCGLRIVSYEDSYQMCTKEEYYDNLIKINSVPKKYVLTDVLLETLSMTRIANQYEVG